MSITRTVKLPTPNYKNLTIGNYLKSIPSSGGMPLSVAET